MSKQHNSSHPNLVFRRTPRYRYVPVQETLHSDELGSYVSYAISVRTAEEEIAFVSDVSTDFEEIERLADLCTEKQLDPEQLPDVLEDFLVECTVPTV